MRPHHDLERLVRRAGRGDERAAEEITRRCGAPVRRIVRRRLGREIRSRVDTEDILQSAFLTALGALRDFRYEGERAFVGWISTIAEQKIRNAARHHRAALRDVRRQRPLSGGARVPDDGTSPTQGAVRGEIVRDIRQAVEKLPERQRSVVLLHSFEGRSFPDIAERLGLTDKSAARRLFQRALRELGNLMDA